MVKYIAGPSPTSLNFDGLAGRIHPIVAILRRTTTAKTSLHTKRVHASYDRWLGQVGPGASLDEH